MYLPCLSAEISSRIQKSAVVSIGVGLRNKSAPIFTHNSAYWNIKECVRLWVWSHCRFLLQNALTYDIYLYHTDTLLSASERGLLWHIEVFDYRMASRNG